MHGLSRVTTTDHQSYYGVLLDLDAYSSPVGSLVSKQPCTRRIPPLVPQSRRYAHPRCATVCSDLGCFVLEFKGSFFGCLSHLPGLGFPAISIFFYFIPHPPLTPRMYPGPEGILGTAHVGVQQKETLWKERVWFGRSWCSVCRRKGFLAFRYAAQSHPILRLGPFLSPLLIP